MAEKTWSQLVDQDLRPAYYDDFQCLGADCQLTCCKGWKINFDKKDYLSLKREKGSPELVATLADCVRRIRGEQKNELLYGEFVLGENGCPLQSKEGLCSLQLERGHAALPLVCRIFPRIEMRALSGYYERSLSPACEAVLHLLWDLPDGVDFRSDQLPRAEWRNMNVHNAEARWQAFGDIRSVCIDFLQDRRFPLSRRIQIMGVLLKDLVDRSEERDVSHWLEKARALLTDPLAAQLCDSMETDGGNCAQAMYLAQNIHLLASSAAQSPDIDSQMESKGVVEALGLTMKAVIEGHVTLELAPYRKIEERFMTAFGDKEYFFENLMVALFFHLHFPNLASVKETWKSYVNFCNLYSFYHFMAVMSCREGSACDRDSLFRAMVIVSRSLIHNQQNQTHLRDELFQNDSDSLAHMSILLNG